MHINFTRALLTLQGDTLRDEQGKPISLRDVSQNALLGSYPDEENLPGTKKAERWRLAQRLDKGTTVRLTAEEVSLLKDLIGKAYAPLVVGQAYEMLEGDVDSTPTLPLTLPTDGA